MTKPSRVLTLSTLLALLAACPALCRSAQAQAASQAAPADSLPDSPGATAAAIVDESSSMQNSSTSQPPPQNRGTREKPPKRLFGIVPNFRSVSTDETLPRQTKQDKFIDATKDSFDYSSLVLVSTVSLVSYAANSDPEFGRGGLGYGRYLWHAAADQTIENYLVEFIIPVIAHEDTRFYTLTRGSVARRAGSSLRPGFVSQTDSGRPTFNPGEIFGAAAAAGISNFYYPRAARTFSNFGSKYATSLGIDAAAYFVKEFYPDISHVFTRGKHQPTP